MKRRKKFFKTREEAKKYLKMDYERKYVTEPRPEEMSVFKFKYPVAGRKYFLGTAQEYDFERFS